MAILGYWRAWSRPLLAVLVVLTLLIPTWDAFQCVAEFSDSTFTSADVHAGKIIVAKDIGGKPLNIDNDADPLCPHSHCHHPAGMPSMTEHPAMPTVLTRLEPPWSIYHIPPSPPSSGLLRPPRA
jgi:hypothetical protein